ncbi:hypothetical protein [Microseira sp. BLCC-F43]|uniref:hypothetical protein n=1 Tax=Microseira sp. BLCC-F43 TaxID=3153602 RepID=UPI0035B76A81
MPNKVKWTNSEYTDAAEVKNLQDTVSEMREQRQKFNQAVADLVGSKTEIEADKKAKYQKTTSLPSDLKA